MGHRCETFGRIYRLHGRIVDLILAVYNARMNEALADFIEARKHFVWYVKDHRALDEESIVQATLNYGNWNDVQELIRILGMDHVAEVFYRDIAVSPRRRGNYYPDVVRYFTLYFKRHAPAVHA